MVHGRGAQISLTWADEGGRGRKGAVMESQIYGTKCASEGVDGEEVHLLDAAVTVGGGREDGEVMRARMPGAPRRVCATAVHRERGDGFFLVEIALRESRGIVGKIIR